MSRDEPLPPEPAPYVDLVDEQGPQETNWSPTAPYSPDYSPDYGNVGRYGQQVFQGQLPPVVSTRPQGAVQWLVKFNNNGRWEELGAIDVNCTHDDIVERWFDVLQHGGRVLLFPLDNMGRVLHGHDDDPYPVDFSASHDAIKRAKQRRVQGTHSNGVGGAGPGGIPGFDLNSFITRLEDRHKAEMAALRTELRNERERLNAWEERLRDERKQLDEQRTALAVTSSQQTAEQMGRVQDALSASHTQQTNQLVAVMTQAQSAESARHDRQMESMREAARIDSQRREEDRTLREARESRRREDERKDLDRRDKQSREDRNSRETWVAQSHERDLAATREYNERMTALLSQKADSNDMGMQFQKMATYAVTMASTMGIDLKDGGLKQIITSLTGGGSSSILDTVGDVAKTVATAAVEMKKLEQGEDDEMVIVQTPNGPMQMKQSELMAFQQQMIAMQQGQPQQQIAGPQAYQGQPMPTDGAGAWATPQAPTEPELPGYTPWGEPQQAQAIPQPQAPQQRQAQPPAIVTSNPANHLPPQVQKAARQAAKAIVTAVAAVPSPQRPAALLQGLQQHGTTLYPYLQAAGLTYTLREAGADAALAGEILSLADQSGLLPADVPR